MYVVGRPAIWNRERFHELLEEILSTGILTNNGPLVRELEKRVGELMQAHCVAVSSATLGLELVSRGLELGGRIVAVPAFTFVATAHAISQAGAKPLFCDIELETLSIDLSSIKDVPLGAIVLVNLFGGCGDQKQFESFAFERGIPLVIDSSHALGTKFNTSALGSFGTASVFSLHATKIVNGFEGGLVVTKNEDLAERICALRNFGFASEGVSPHRSSISWGTNAKLSEVHAAMAISNLECIGKAIEKNKENFILYKKHLPVGIDLVEFPPFVEPNFQFVIGQVDLAVRDHLVQFLLAHDCQTRIYFDPPCHLLPPYRSETQPPLPTAEAFAKSSIALPTGPSIGEKEIAEICQLIQKGLTEGLKL